MKLLVTGGAGFIGSAAVRLAVARGHEVVNLDALTYAANPANVAQVTNSPLYRFEQADLRDRPALDRVLAAHRPDVVLHLAAESHVDRSIDGPGTFVETNVMGTFNLLEAARAHWLREGRPEGFRFHHVSTDEVFGDLPLHEGEVPEDTPDAPSAPSSASKAASDHLVRAWGHTYGLPVVVSNCSNNYGPFHFPEKLIPLVILNALHERPLPVYGKGANVRDWLYVDDHARALELIATKGRPGETYLIGGRAEKTNLEVVEAICDLLDERRTLRDNQRHRDLITYVADRPGHDRRYAIDPSKIEEELGWRAQESFETGLAKTVDWYLAREDWWRPLREQRYGGERLGRANGAGAGGGGRFS